MESSIDILVFMGLQGAGKSTFYQSHFAATHVYISKDMLKASKVMNKAARQAQQLEYDLTCRYLTRYLPSTGSILEIGAATGRYTLALCQRGYTVTAVDL